MIKQWAAALHSLATDRESSGIGNCLYFAFLWRKKNLSGCAGRCQDQNMNQLTKLRIQAHPSIVSWLVLKWVKLPSSFLGNTLKREPSLVWLWHIFDPRHRSQQSVPRCVARVHFVVMELCLQFLNAMHHFESQETEMPRADASAPAQQLSRDDINFAANAYF